MNDNKAVEGTKRDAKGAVRVRQSLSQRVEMQNNASVRLVILFFFFFGEYIECSQGSKLRIEEKL